MLEKFYVLINLISTSVNLWKCYLKLTYFDGKDVRS